MDLLTSGEFVDTAGPDAPCALGGRWGVYDDDATTRKATDGKGSHVWLWIRRAKCRGVPGLHADLRLHGAVAFEARLEDELALRSGRAPSRPPDRVAGSVVYGDIPDMEYSALVGSFSLTPAAGPLPAELRRRLPVAGLSWDD